MEDLKERYFDVALRVERRLRAGTLPAFVYKMDEDLKAKAALLAFEARSREQQQEEAFLAEYLQRATPHLSAVWRTREQILMHFAGGAQSVSMYPTIADLLGHPKAVKASDASGPKAVRVRDRTKERQKNRQKKTEEDKAEKSSGPGRKPKPPAFATTLRSLSLKPIRVGLCRHVDRMLLDLGLPTRPACPTAAVIAKYDELRLLLCELDGLTRTKSESQSASGSVTNLSGPPSRPQSPVEARVRGDCLDLLEGAAAKAQPVGGRWSIGILLFGLVRGGGRAVVRLASLLLYSDQSVLSYGTRRLSPVLLRMPQPHCIYTPSAAWIMASESSVVDARPFMSGVHTLLSATTASTAPLITLAKVSSPRCRSMKQLERIIEMGLAWLRPSRLRPTWRAPGSYVAWSRPMLYPASRPGPPTMPAPMLVTMLP